ncbi:ABC transporter permease [Phototrophicus methaneseepsis]|uniref:ABC transporter permease n=1 Tax=Phototrophicus methaneseepsis TaxID=2710758 RepID=A0A7S8EBA6_9CHLR|nr:ABC transporter permease [Phototrophicus methaneseepsis]QPC83823.1 ABC transporter permease [Phototrophicus methaneseepsis]
MATASVTQERTWAASAMSGLRYYLPTILVAVGVLLIWELAVIVFDIKQFLLPKPSVILGEFLTEVRLFLMPGQTSLLFEATGATFREALGGFIIGCGAGVLVALLTARWTILTEAAMPFAIAANSVPIIAFAPIMNNWFGLTNPASKMAIVAIIVFFPTMINTVRGLTLVDARQLELMHSYAASPFKILFSLRIPNALPYIFNALRVASPLSLIGAVVAEFFGGPRATLGVFITQEASSFDFARSWTAILMASLIGISFYLVVLIGERLAMPWYREQHQQG